MTAEDLLLNDIFIEHCLGPNARNTEKWEAIVRDNNISAEVIAEAKAMLSMLTPGLGKAEVEDEVLKLEQAMREREIRTRKIISRISVFAGLMLAIGSVLFFALRKSQPSEAHMLANIYRTTTGEQKRVTLPDGSIVILNSNTFVSIGENYNITDRKVHLRGSAFFKVAKNASKSFSVISEDFSTTALGTSFYVNADSLQDFSVRLLEGKVRINSGKIKTTAYLDPGEELKCPRAKPHFIKQSYDTTYLHKWVSGKIVFRKTPVPEAFDILQQWYGVEIIDKRSTRREISINGTYENVLLEDILKVISFSLGCQYRYEQNRIIIE